MTQEDTDTQPPTCTICNETADHVSTVHTVAGIEHVCVHCLDDAEQLP